MSAPTLPHRREVQDPDPEQTPAQHHPYRWRLHRGGILNVWYYYDTEFEFAGGRLVLRGTNGSGKSRALELLLPFVLDADRRKMDASGAGKVRLQDLMRAGPDDQQNRAGYLWLELVRDVDDDAATRSGPGPQYLTLGAFVRSSKSSGEAKVWYFTTPQRVGHDLVLLDGDRRPLPRELLTEQIGAERVTESPEVHRERVRTTVFGLTGELGRERFAGLLQLLHTLRSPDVGNRIEEGRLPQILSDALPPLSETALLSAGEQLDGLSETRAAQQRLDESHAHVATFLDTYRRYVVEVLRDTAEQARAAAGDSRRAETAAQTRQQEHATLISDLGAARAALSELEGAQAELDATISGIKASKEYTDARDLDERARKVDALAGTADRALAAAAAAREAELGLVHTADARADEAQEAAAAAAAALGDARRRLHDAGVRSALPDMLAVRSSPPVAVEGTVRAGRLEDMVTLQRPAPAAVEVGPADVPDTVAQIRRVQAAATQRSAHAGTRLQQAEQLDSQRRRVDVLDERAGEAEKRAADASQEAEQAAERRDQAATALAQRWREWTQDDTARRLFGEMTWSATPVAMLISDPDAVTGDGAEALLRELDQAANEAATPLRDRHAAVLAELDLADGQDAGARRTLEHERQQLRADVDPRPEAPTWMGPAAEGSIPLWRAVDFAEHVTPEHRAGLESALLASGLLVATITGDGDLAAADGQLLVSATGATAGVPLSEALVVDADSPIRAEIVTDVLSRIAIGERSHGTWVDTDGSWGNGPLTGRHQGPDARHIGAAARAAARATRLVEIDALLEALTAAAATRSAQRDRVAADRVELQVHLRTAPRSEPVVTTRALVADTRMRAATAGSDALVARTAAERLRTEWTAALRVHRAACTSFDLPSTAPELAAVRHEAREAAISCDGAVRGLESLRQCLSRHAHAYVQVGQARRRRADSEHSAESDWRRWHGEAAELAAVEESVGAEAAQVRAHLRAAEIELDERRHELFATRATESRLGGAAGAAEVEARTAGERADAVHGRLVETAALLTSRLALPGVAAAATGRPELSLALTQVDPAGVEAAVRTVLGALDQRGSAADENALIRAQQLLERELSGTFDVLAYVEVGVRMVEVTDATSRRTIAAACAELDRLREEGRAALSDRERRVFTDFVLGGVAEELRRRLAQAAALIRAMNTSLASIRTSHGIGVKLRWSLSEAAGPSVARIRDRVTTAGDVRSAAGTAELTELLKARVDEAFASDPTSGYAAHLRTAMDYRGWHEIVVIITGPEPGRERRISRRAKLSQGETRFVSYVTLFAAVDAYLSGLPDTGRALRLLLLDDAFAKVDERTIGELMGLLVRLDVDFAMTGHALWGCYPQVPALDCYEVRRREGTAAVTTHVHWDGHTRHLRAAR